MDIVLTGLAFIAAALCAGLMGFAIQRGGTCTVAAVDEFIANRRINRLRAMAEASLWVAGGLVLANSLELLSATPTGYAVSRWTLIGGALLGLGAYVNQACVFGAIARFGLGEWVYVATPIGFYVGCVTVGLVFAPPAAQPLTEVSPVLRASVWVAIPFIVFAGWRVVRPLFGVRSAASARDVAGRIWSPHVATTVIGITFFFILLLIGSWAYTEALADLARHMSMNVLAKSVLLLALFLGALLGGWTAGRFHPTRFAAAPALRCFTGGMLMGWGSLLIPGANDGLILIGMPLLWPYAWLAFLTMCLAIAAALWTEEALLPRRVSH